MKPVMSRVAVLAATLVILAQGSVSAHSPIPYKTTQYNPNVILNANWDTSKPPPQAMKDKIKDAMDDVASSRESRAPRIAMDGTGPSGRIAYLPYGQSASCVIGQLACAGRDPADTSKWRVRFTEDGENGNGFIVDWCEDPGGSGSCWKTRHIALHEFGHILALGHSDDDNYENDAPNQTVMQSSQPTNQQAGGTEYDFQNCDRARLQWLYGRIQFDDQLAGCHDHAAWAVNGGIPTQVGIQAHGDNVDFDVCTGESATFKGSLRIQDITSGSHDLNRLANSKLAGRTVSLQRRNHGPDDFNTYATDVTDDDGVWEITVTFQLVHDFDFRSAFFDGVGSLTVGLNDDKSTPMRVRWVSC